MLLSARLGTLIALLLKHRHIRPSSYPTLVILFFVCLLLQRAIRKESRLYRDTVRHVPIPDGPIFITGHWRSGTTHLHYLLSRDTENFAFPTSYQSFLPTAFLTLDESSWFYKISRRIDDARPSRTRPLDNTEFGLTLPQEDEFVYVPEGGYSYIVESLFFPRTAVTDHEEIVRLSNDEKSQEIILRFYKKLTFIHRKRIVSKSPGHFARIPSLKRVFPASKFIVIVRNPYEVAASALRAKNLYGRRMALQARVDDGMPMIAKFLSFYFETLERHLTGLREEEHVLVKYEDLVREPVGTVESVYQGLGLTFSATYRAQLTTYLDSLRGYTGNRLELDRDTRALVYNECRHIFRTYGYER